MAPPVNGDAAAKITTTKSAVGFVPQTTPALHDGTPFLYRIDSKPRWALICLAPKAGSSMWKRALVKGLLDQGLPMLDAPGQWHGQPLPYNTSAERVALSKVTRIMIVRHPVPRLLSAYLGKGLTNRINVSGWDRAQGFRGFVDAIIHTNRSDLDLHYAPQFDQCGIRELHARNVNEQLGYRYLRVEEMGHWYREIVCALGLSKTVSTASTYWRNFYVDSGLSAASRTSASYNESIRCFVRTRDCGCDLHCPGHHCNSTTIGTFPDASFATFNQASERLEDFYDAELARRVEAWAADDMRELGYRPWVIGATGRATGRTHSLSSSA